MHESSVISRVRSDAVRLESSKAGARRGEIKGKVAEQLLEAAKLYAQIGDFESYCNIMIELGEWTTAIAIAPKVSMEYWSSLVSQYADVLNKSMSEKCIPFYLASGRAEEAISVYFDRKDFQSALVVSKVLDGDNTVPKSPTRAKQSTSLKSDWASATRPDTLEDQIVTPDSGFSNRSIKLRSKATSFLVDSYLSKSQSLLAAASYASSSDIFRLVQLLKINGDYDMAYLVSDIFELPDESLRYRVAQLLVEAGVISAAIDVLGGRPQADLMIGRLLCRSSCDEGDVCAWISKSKVKNHQWWLQNAREEESIGCDHKAVLSYILSWNFEQAGNRH